MRLHWLAMAPVIALLIARATPADVLFDGTLGPAGPAPTRSVPGFTRDYLIDYDETLPLSARQGERMGPNLYQSLERLDLLGDERATFQATGATGIERVFARITNRQPSRIAGVIRSEIPNADLFLLNPAGVIFDGQGGSRGQLDVPGSFAVTTADLIRFDDGSEFHADSGVGTTLSSAAPIEFGFLGGNAASVEFRGNETVALEPASQFTVVAGEVVFSGDGSNKQVAVPQGILQLAAVGTAAANVPLRLDDWSTRALPEDSLGEISIEQFASLSGSGDGVPRVRVVLRGGDLVVDNASIVAGANDAPTSLDLDVGMADAIIVRNDSRVQTGPNGIGSARLVSRTVEVDGTGSFLGSISQAPLVGAVSIEADTLSVTNDGKLSSFAVANGQGADLSIRADIVRANGDGEITSEAFGSATGGALSIDAGQIHLSSGGVIAAIALGDAVGGDISVDVENVLLSDGGQIVARTEGSGDAGSIDVSVREVLEIRATGSDAAGILARAGEIRGGAVAGSGGVGNVDVSADSIVLDGFAQISGTTLTDQNAGDVTVVAADTIRITGSDPTQPAGLFARSGNRAGGAPFSGSGDGGNLSVNAPNLMLEGNAVISTRSLGEGNPGTLEITASQRLSLVGNTSGVAEISARAQDGTEARSHIIDTGILEITGGSAISSSTLGSAPGGSITIIADSLRVAGTSATGSTSAILSESFSLATDAGSSGSISLDIEGAAEITESGEITVESRGPGDAGAIELIARTVTIEDGGALTATAERTGRAGEVRVEADAITISDGSITTEVRDGPEGGNIVLLTPGRLSLSDGARVSARSNGSQDAGNILIEADRLQATSSEITTEALAAAGGNIEIVAVDSVDLVSSEITTSVLGRVGEDDAGNVTIRGLGAPAPGGLPRVDSVVVNRSDILAQATLGDGGSIAIASDVYLESADSVVDASSDEGIDGTVDIDAPDVDLKGSLVQLPSNFLDAASLLRQQCAARLAGRGSFVISDRDGMTEIPDGPLPSSMPLPMESSTTSEGAPPSDPDADSDPSAAIPSGAHLLVVSDDECRALLGPREGIVQ